MEEKFSSVMVALGREGGEEAMNPSPSSILFYNTSIQTPELRLNLSLQ